MSPEELDALARATMASALMQLATHFPTELEEELELSIPEALERALTLAEEAISLAPGLPDGHVALGRLLLCHDDPQALTDAIEVLDHALGLDAEHDAAEVALATALRETGQTDRALEHTERVLKRGSGQAQPLVLRALLHLDRGNTTDARRDLERAIRIAPAAGLFRLDAARAAEAAGDDAAAGEHHDSSQQLLGATYDAARRGLEQKK